MQGGGRGGRWHNNANNRRQCSFDLYIYAQISHIVCVWVFVLVFVLQVSATTLTKANRLHFPDCIGISNGIKIKIENEIAIAIEMEIENGK